MSEQSTAVAAAAPAGEGEETTELGESGEKALEAFKSRAREAEKQAKAEAKARVALEQRLAQVEESTKTEGEKALEQARKEAAATAAAEARAAWSSRYLSQAVRAAAGGKLADPSDAVRLLDLSEFEVDDDGEVDAKAIDAAIDDLLSSKPYLAAKGGRPRGDVDQGPRTNAGPVDPRAADIAQIEADLKAGARRR